MPFHHGGNFDRRVDADAHGHGCAVEHRRETGDLRVDAPDLVHGIGISEYPVFAEARLPLVHEIGDAAGTMDESHPHLAANLLRRRTARWVVDVRRLDGGPDRLARRRPGFQIGHPTAHQVEPAHDVGLPRLGDGVDVERNDIRAATGRRVVVLRGDHAALRTSAVPPGVGDGLAEVQVYGARGVDGADLAVGSHHILGADAVAMAAPTRGLRVIRLVDMQPSADDPLVQERDRLRRLLDDEMQAMPLDLGKPPLRWRPPKADECVDAQICEGGGAARLLQPHRDGKEAGVLRQTVGKLARMRLHILIAIATAAGRGESIAAPAPSTSRPRHQYQPRISPFLLTVRITSTCCRPSRDRAGRSSGWPRVEP